MNKKLTIKNQHHDRTIEKQVVEKDSLPARLFGYHGGIMGGNVEGLMTKVHEEKEE